MRYTVKTGDNLFKIWRENYMKLYTFEEFKNFFIKENGERDINMLKMNEIIILPSIQISNTKKVIIPVIITIFLVSAGIFAYTKLR